ncbi:hypothetical protein HanRHA438_Chr08g0347031 [Helianthus annuus]|nr:hypothetical protein HanRHA438_Chr08g0347031 [Helianthus annuus]
MHVACLPRLNSTFTPTVSLRMMSCTEIQRVSKRLLEILPKCDVYLVSLSEIMDTCTLCKATILATYNWANMSEL